MQIQVNSDATIDSSKFADVVEAEVQAAVGRHADRITRVEVHFQDVNAQKGGEDDIRCMMEVRIAGLKPLAVDERAGTVGAAIAGAADKLERLVDHTLERLDEPRHTAGPPLSDEPPPDLLPDRRH